MLPRTVPLLEGDERLDDPAELAWLIENVSRYSAAPKIENVPIPERPGILRMAPVEKRYRVHWADLHRTNSALYYRRLKQYDKKITAVNKPADDLEDVFPESRRKVSYFYLDTSPLSILLNKYTIRSCHTLDNREHEFRGGNFNWIHTPYMACLFGKKTDPLSETAGYKSPESPITGEMFRFSDGYVPKMRQHTAVANVFTMVDDRGRPYLYLNRIYDSSAVDHTSITAMREYLMTWAEDNGFGFATDDTEKMDDWHKHHDGRRLRTPSYSLPYRDSDGDGVRLVGYCDHNLTYSAEGCYVEPCATIIEPNPDRYTLHAREIVELGKLPSPSILMYGTWGPGRAGVEEEDDDEEYYWCGLCEGRYTGEPDYSHPRTGSPICSDCYHDNWTECQECHEEVLRDNASTTARGDDVCESCREEYYQPCSRCDELVDAEPEDAGPHICYGCLYRQDRDVERAERATASVRPSWYWDDCQCFLCSAYRRDRENAQAVSVAPGEPSPVTEPIR